MGIFDEISKQKKRITLMGNKFRSKVQEDAFPATRPFDIVKRTGRGSDFSGRKRNLITGRVGPETLYELKSSERAPLSKLQKETQRKTKRYRVIRSSPFGF